MSKAFHHTSVVVAGAFFALAGVWLFAPQLLLTSWGLDHSTSVEVLGRRIAMPLAGFGVLSFVFRNAGPSPARSAMVGALVTFLLGTAVLGFVEILLGTTTAGIVPASLIELGLALALLNAVRQDKHQTKKKENV